MYMHNFHNVVHSKKSIIVTMLHSYTYSKSTASTIKVNFSNCREWKLTCDVCRLLNKVIIPYNHKHVTGHMNKKLRFGRRRNCLDRPAQTV